MQHANGVEMPAANFQIDGTFTESTFMRVKPDIGFTDYTICVRVLLIRLRGSTNAILGYIRANVQDAITLGKISPEKRDCPMLQDWPNELISFSDFSTNGTYNSDTSVEVKMCEASKGTSNYCLNIPLDHAPFEVWTHLCMTARHIPASETRTLLGYIDGVLRGQTGISK